MRKYLRISILGTRPETALAQEYNSNSYILRGDSPELLVVTWESDALPTESLIGLLLQRGWHQTDIGDELDEARAYSQSAL